MTETTVRAVVLAGGASRRTAPLQKLVAAFRGRPLIDYAIETALPWEPVVVAGPVVARALRGRTDCAVLLNEYPERGMSYSLKLADAIIAREASLLVFLADKPLVSRDIARAIASDLAQVAFPVHAETSVPGHPVLLDASVRWKIASLPDGDTLHRLRDDAACRRNPISTVDRGAFFDVDEVMAK